MSNIVKFALLEKSYYSRRDSGYFRGDIYEVDLADLVTLIDWGKPEKNEVEAVIGHGIRYVSTTSSADPNLFITTAFGKTSAQHLNAFLADHNVDYYHLSPMRSPAKVKKPSKGQIVIPLYVEEDELGKFTIEVYPSAFVPDVRGASESKRDLFSQIGQIDYEDRFTNLSFSEAKAFYSSELPFLIISDLRSLRGVRDRIF